MREGTQYKSREDMEYHFKWVRKHFYTDLLKVFLAKDVDDYNDYKFDLYYNFHSLDILKYDNNVIEKYIKSTLLRSFDVENNIELVIDYYNKRNNSLFEKYNIDNSHFVSVGNCTFESKDVIIPKDITVSDLDKDKFVWFVNQYINWLATVLIKCGDVSFYKVNKKIDELLGWDEKKEYLKKRELQKAKEYRYNQSFNISHNSEMILGECFIELFHKLYKKEYDADKKELLNEMEFLFDYIRNSVHTNGKKHMLDGDIRDGFLTAGACPEDIVEMNKEEIIDYDRFSTYLLFYKSVEKAFELMEKE